MYHFIFIHYHLHTHYLIFLFKTMTGFCSVWGFHVPFLIFSGFLSSIHYFHYLSVSRQHGCSPPFSSSCSSPTCVHLVWAVTPLPPPPPLPPSPPDGAVLVQTRAAQRLVARAGQCGALGGCVSLSPHLWDGLRLSVVSTPPTPPPAQ